ncbi:hypothetical protein [Nocardiopsis synnemataformans]|uniref:hypothetical protein n=1 Tax=Nocardiopsis synnemataformans TaxID=61305 RepID=UPI003EBEC52D
MPRTLAECGTLGAYQRHVRNKESIDRLCRVAGRLQRPVTPADLCDCAACCCDQGGEHCRQRGCRFCLDRATLIG